MEKDERGTLEYTVHSLIRFFQETNKRANEETIVHHSLFTTVRSVSAKA